MRVRYNCIFRDGSAHHIYLKALDGNVLFYRTEDYVFFLTLLYKLARRYGIKIESVCIMFNHIHLFVKPTDSNRFRAFVNDLQHQFSVIYNKEYSLCGTLMMHAGFAPKSSRKSILSCLIYIVNNPVAGNLTSKAMDYKWNLLAYYESNCPFSDRLVKRESRFRMRKALKLVDYDSLVSRFGSFDSLIIAADSTTGSEYDIIEPREDYSIYARMLRITMSSGINHGQFHFNKMKKEDFMRLGNALTATPRMTPDHLRRFLRLPVIRPSKGRDL